MYRTIAVIGALAVLGGCRSSAPPPERMALTVPLPAVQVESTLGEQVATHVLEFFLPTGPAATIGIALDSTVDVAPLIEQLRERSIPLRSYVEGERIEIGKQALNATVTAVNDRPISAGTLGVGITPGSATLVVWLSEHAKTHGYIPVGRVVQGLDQLEPLLQQIQAEKCTVILRVAR